MYVCIYIIQHCLKQDNVFNNNRFVNRLLNVRSVNLKKVFVKYFNILSLRITVSMQVLHSNINLEISLCEKLLHFFLMSVYTDRKSFITAINFIIIYNDPTKQFMLLMNQFILLMKKFLKPTIFFNV